MIVFDCFSIVNVNVSYLISSFLLQIWKLSYQYKTITNST